MRPFWIATLFLTSAAANASTWVGNGGNAGDIELRLAMNQTRSALEAVIERESAKDLCSCPEELRNNSLCGYVDHLDAVQIASCEKTLKAKAPELLALIDSGRVRIGWTTEPMDVREGGTRRAADAVADTRSNRLTLQQPRFLALSPGQRIFLLTHEHLHFLSMDGKPFEDEGEVGPFKGPEGGRTFINSMSAGLAMTAFSEGFIARDLSVLYRSRGAKENWFDLSLNGLQRKGDSSFTPDHTSGAGVSFRKYWGNFGVSAEYSSYRASDTLQGTIDIEEKDTLLALGVSYRFFPFDDPLSYWGPSHLVLGAKAANLRSTYSLKESPVDESDTSNVSGLGLDCHYYIPFQHGFWGFAGVGYLQARPEYSKLNLEGKLDRKNGAVTTAIGVSYGF